MPRSTWLTKLLIVFSVLVLLGIWQIGANVINARVILPTPGETFDALFALLRFRPLSLNILATVGRAMRSFLIIFAVGGALGVLAGYSKGVDAFLQHYLVI